MSWRDRTISVALLAVLTGLPVGGTACAVLCESGVTSPHHAPAASHHGSGNTGRKTAHTDKKSCQELPTSTDVQIRGGAGGHDCGSHPGAGLQAGSFAVDRADAGLRSAPPVSLIAPVFITTPDVDSHPLYSRPPGTAPPTSTPFVLRV